MESYSVIDIFEVGSNTQLFLQKDRTHSGIFLRPVSIISTCCTRQDEVFPDCPQSVASGRSQLQLLGRFWQITAMVPASFSNVLSTHFLYSRNHLTLW